MQVFRAPLTEADEAAIREMLFRGGIGIIPTDTVYGVIAAPGDNAALSRIIAAKGRDPKKPNQLLCADVAAVERCSGHALSREERKLAKAFWPGALTLVVRVPESIHGTEGFRVPADATARTICRLAGGLLRCTSANRSGDPDTLTAQAAMAEIPGADFVVDGGSCRPDSRSSTVVRIMDGGEIRIFREAALSRQQIAAVLKS
ncbi:MAG: L-threonylcarbamoyladenylate synthase [Kiritimatiellia bacterium]